MTKPMNYSPQPQQFKTSPVAAANWLGDLIKLFPPTSDMSPEKMRAMVEIFTQYPESALKQICSPLTGIATSFEFLPGLFRFKEYCDRKSFEEFENERRVRDSLKAAALPAPPPDPRAGCYTGPIEQIKPGDILYYERFDEYREFMRTNKNMSNIKLWGVNEVYRDNSGQRPFQLTEKPVEIIVQENPKPNPNPFE